MAANVLIVEGEPPEIALAGKRAAGATPARRVAAALAEIDPTLSFAFAAPFFSDHDPAKIAFEGACGVLIAGSGFACRADDAAAGPFRDLCARAFAAGLPVFGSGWGLQILAASLGGAVEAGPEPTAVARDLRALEHPMTAGRRSTFDALSFQQGAIAEPPAGAVVTALTASGGVHGFAVAEGGVDARGVLHRPDAHLADIAWRLAQAGDGRRPAATAHHLKLIGEDPVAHARLAAKHRIGLDILDRAYHLTELRVWLEDVAARASGAS